MITSIANIGAIQPRWQKSGTSGSNHFESRPAVDVITSARIAIDADGIEIELAIPTRTEPDAVNFILTNDFAIIKLAPNRSMLWDR